MGVIQCGSFSGNTTVTLGWEPQWIMIKRTDSTGDWITIDSMRGCAVGGIDAVLFPNLANAESVASDYIDFTPTGFISKNLTGTYIYTVIRRPMKVPTSGTEVFAVDIANNNGSATSPEFTSGFPVDMMSIWNRTQVEGAFFSNRLTGDKTLATSSTSAESSHPYAKFDFNNGAWGGAMASNYFAYMFKRAKGFFDIVCYTGTGVARTVNHNLGVVPELMIVKRRDITGDWSMYLAPLGNTYMTYLNTTQASAAYPAWNNTTPTASVFSLNGAGYGVNNSAATYIAYLFSSLIGISKVSSYIGNGTSQTINCNFTTGARFILIRRTDTDTVTSNSFIWDTARGIVASNDPHLSLNTTAAEVTTDDSIDPDSSGFIVNQVAATNINVTSANYIFLAIA